MEVRTSLAAALNHATDDAISELERQLREERAENHVLHANYKNLLLENADIEGQGEQLHERWVDERIRRGDMSHICIRQAKEIKKLRRLLRVVKQCKKNRKQQRK